MRDRIRGACVAAALTASGGTAAWQSALLPLNATSGEYEAATVAFAGRNWRLPDYSYGGYRLGADSLGSGVPCASIALTATGDITDELQGAVDALGKSGGGTVLIPAGRYTVSRSIAVPYSNVSIAGAGSALTFLEVPATYDPASDTDEGVFTLGKAAGGFAKFWIDRGVTLAEASAVVREGDTTVDVADASGVAVGAWVVVTQYFSAAFSQRNAGGAWASYAGFPDPSAGGVDRTSSFAYLRQVLGKSGNRLTLDAPIPWTLDPAVNPVRLRDAENSASITAAAMRAKTNLGVAGLSIEFADNDNATDGRPVGAGVYFEGVRDAWAYDVQVRNFPRYGFYLDTAARVTLLDSAALGAQNYGLDGYGYGINVRESQHVLVKRAYVEDSRHGYTSRTALTSSLVVTQSESAASRLSDDAHYAPSQGALWDRHRLTFGSGLHGYYRDTQSAGAHETVGSAAYWNVSGDGGRGGFYGGSLQLNPSADGWGIVVGPQGLDVFDIAATLGTGERINPGAALQVGSVLEAAAPGSRDRNVLYDGVDVAGLSPESLYETQLANRLLPPADFSASCRAPPARGAFTRALYSGTGVLVFDSDHLGYAPIIGGSCSGCEIDSRARNLTPGGRDSFAIQMGATNFGIGATFRGPLRSTPSYEALVLSVYPAQAGLEFRARLSQQNLPEGTNYASLGDFIVAGLVAGQWNSVTIPLTEYDAGNFNSIELRSSGSASAVAFHLDDVVLVEAAAPPAVCADGVDNDGDNRVDHPADAGCTSPVDGDEFDPQPVCNDGRDNDGDALADFPADPGCTAATDDNEFNPPPTTLTGAPGDGGEAGAIGWLALLGLLGVAALRRRRV